MEQTDMDWCNVLALQVDLNIQDKSKDELYCDLDFQSVSLDDFFNFPLHFGIKNTEILL